VRELVLNAFDGPEDLFVESHVGGPGEQLLQPLEYTGGCHELEGLPVASVRGHPFASLLLS
jgi:hypothetical protein